MADVFISYHEKTEGAIAAEIASKLESAGITCWYAKRDVPPGGDFTHEVITQIEKCKVFLLLLDEGAARSPHVQNEVANAFGHKKIMPYQTDKKDVKSVDWVQYYLKHAQIVPLTDYDALTEQLTRALGGPVKTVTPEPQHVEPKPETVAPKSQSPAPKPKTNVAALVRICVITGAICGVIWGVWFSPIADDDYKAVGGILVGYYIGLLASFIIIFIRAKTTNNRDILSSLSDHSPFIMLTLIWWGIAIIVAFACNRIAIILITALLCFGLVGILTALVAF